MPVKLFFCYAHEDEALLNKLKTHLKPFQREKLIDVWHDRDIKAGTEWEREIDKHLNSAQIILLMVSPDFMSSDYCYSKEMKRAMERHEHGEVHVIPVILRPTSWERTPFSKLQALPRDAKPVTSWYDREAAFLNVAEGIHKVVEELTSPSSVSLPVASLKPTNSEALELYTPPAPEVPVVSPPRSRRSNTGVTIRAARITAIGAIIAAIVGALITGIFLYVDNQLSSPKLTSSATATATGTASAACAAAPTLTGPADGLTLNSRTVTLTWEAPQGCVPDGYTVRISVNLDPEAKPWIVDTGWAPTDYTYTFSADGTYFWHIRACQPCTPFHPGNWSIRSFTIHTSSTPTTYTIGVITALSGHSSLFHSWVGKTPEMIR